MDMHAGGYLEACAGRTIGAKMTVCTTTMGGEPLAEDSLERVICACVLSRQQWRSKEQEQEQEEQEQEQEGGEETEEEATAADLNSEGMARIGMLLLRSVREESAFWLLRAMTGHTLAAPLLLPRSVDTRSRMPPTMQTKYHRRLFSRMVLSHAPAVGTILDTHGTAGITTTTSGRVQQESTAAAELERLAALWLPSAFSSAFVRPECGYARHDVAMRVLDVVVAAPSAKQGALAATAAAATPWGSWIGGNTKAGGDSEEADDNEVIEGGSDDLGGDILCGRSSLLLAVGVAWVKMVAPSIALLASLLTKRTDSLTDIFDKKRSQKVAKGAKAEVRPIADTTSMAAAVLVEQDRLEALWVKASTRTRKGMGQQYNSRREQLGRFHAQCTRLDRLLLGRGKGENGEGGDIRRESVLIQALEHAAGEQDADCTRHTRCRLHTSYQMATLYTWLSY
jgi:hypothetical protein